MSSFYLFSCNNTATWTNGSVLSITKYARGRMIIAVSYLQGFFSVLHFKIIVGFLPLELYAVQFRAFTYECTCKGMAWCSSTHDSVVIETYQVKNGPSQTKLCYWRAPDKKNWFTRACEVLTEKVTWHFSVSSRGPIIKISPRKNN